MTERALLDAAIRWHRAGLMASARAGSVQLTGVFIQELLDARALLRELTESDLTRLEQLDLEEWLQRAATFLGHTADVEAFRK